MNLQDRLNYFDENYDLISNGIYGRGENIYIGSRQAPRKCRFCTDENPKFSTTAHAIPESLGNHQLILLEECDACNKFFSENLEDHFDKYSKPFRTLSQIKGKKKIPSYKSQDHETRIDIKDEFEIKSHIDSEHIEIDEENRKLKMHLDIEPFIPAAAYKALVKMAISTIEDENELHAFDITIKWIKELDHTKAMLNPLQLGVYFVPGPRPTDGVVSMLYRRKPTTTIVTPYSLYILAFGNLAFQLITPSHLDGKSGETISYSIPYFPLPFELDWPFGDVRKGVEDLSGTERKRLQRSFTLQAERMEKNKIS